MKLGKSFWIKMIPIIIIVVVTMAMSLVVHEKMVENEKETCWTRLEIATKSTAEKIRVRITDNLNFLEAVSDSFILTHHLEQEEEVGKYLTSVVEMTIFERIDVLLPTGEMLTQNGEKVYAEGELTYEELLERGTHVSPRDTNPFSNREVIYCFTPIEKDGVVQALLIGTIDCLTLGEIFEVFTYKGDAQLFLIDCADGNYLIDTWHNKLDNLYNIGTRQSIDGKTTIDFVTPMLKRETGRNAYVSNTNGENSYQYYAPVEDFNWEVCVVVQEDIVFEQVHRLEGMLFSIGVVEAIVILLYFVWNLWNSLIAVKSEEKAKKLELEKSKNEAKSRFISNMSHDVRTPLNGIVGMLYIIKTHGEDKKLVEDCLDKIEISAQYLTTLVNDMLDINEIENDKLVLEEVSVDLRKMLDNLNAMIDIKAKEKNINFVIDYSKLLHPFVIGSVVHIERILVNLIGNAMKYSKQTDANVFVYVEEVEVSQQEGIYKFIVADNGIGMTEEFQKTMYNAFEQEKVTARSDYQGYGLGLTIVYQLVKKMGGDISLDSKKGEGSTFTVTLPLKIVEKECNPMKKEDTFIDLNGVKVLLVEDNEFNLEIAEMILTDVGAKVVTAMNGRIATEVFAQSEPYTVDLILMDIMMPELDGCEATKVIRKMDRPDAKSVPIIAMSANAFAEEIQRCKDSGMNEHIAKPLDVDKLMKQVAKYCNKIV